MYSPIVPSRFIEEGLNSRQLCHDSQRLLLLLDEHDFRGFDRHRYSVVHGKLHLVDRLPGNGGT